MRNFPVTYTILSVLLSACLGAQTTTATPDSLSAAPSVQTTDSVGQTPAAATPTADPGGEAASGAAPDTSAAVPLFVTDDDGIPLDVPMANSSNSSEKRKRPGSGPSQARTLRKANELFTKKAYAEAIPYYEKARQGDSTNATVLANLAECYRLTNNSMGELHSYGALVRAGSSQGIQRLYYAQALMEIGEEEKAREFFEKYNSDERGKNLAASFLKKKEYTRNADAYSVFPASFNSDQNDLCAVKFHDATVFTSSRQKNNWIRREQGWTDGAYMQLYVAGRGANGEEVAPQLFMSDLKSKYNDGPLSFTKDYNTVYFTRNNFKKDEKAADGTFKLKILEATLEQNGFSMVKKMPFENKEYNYAHPSISADGYVLYFASDAEGGKGGMDIYMSRRDSSGLWGTPVNLGEKVNTAGNEVFPFSASNGLLYFSSDGHDGLGGLDIYEVQMKEGMPSKIYNMGEPVNSNRDDFGIYIAEDNKTGFISSNRKAGGMDDDIYNLQILREVKRGKEVTMLVKDLESGQPVDSAKVVFNGDTLYTNATGEAQGMIEEGQVVKIDVLKKDYFNLSDSVTTASSEEEKFTKEVVIEKDPKLFLRGLVSDAKTGEPLEGATVKLTDLTTNTEVDEYTTTTSGDYFKFLFGSRIGDKLAYLVKISKPGYLERTMVFTHSIEKPGEVNMNELLNLSLGKVEVGMDLAKMIDIKPIYFDYGKSTIRKDAAEELDKIVTVMNEYPNMSIELGSHTDCRSSVASNLKLSGARAKSSVDYIVKRGINKTRISGKGYGESKLLNNCACEGKTQSPCPEEEHSKNRRTEFIITRLK
jgi:outer membrane protein OmpA-like peptidoglycan-associated protein/tetratricopeptide (TPR) repeat protein